MTAYYNEVDPAAAAALRALIADKFIAPGDVDERSIEDVSPVDLMGYTQCHFFAGQGVWSYALRLAGWQQEPAAASRLRRNSRPGPTNGVWRDADWLGCRDEKWRPVEPGTQPLAHGTPARVGQLRLHGNAIVAPQAAAFIESYIEVMESAE